MSANHTPEPWRVLVVYDIAQSAQRVTVCTPYTYAPDGAHISERHIADCGPFVDDGEAHHNARLIAEAPAMARLLQRYLDSVAHPAGAEALAVLRRINGYYDD